MKAALKLFLPLVLPSILTLVFNSAANAQQEGVDDLLVKKQFSKAYVLAQQNLSESQSAANYLAKGNVEWSICDYRNAVADFDRALNLDQNLLEAQIHKAICLARLGESGDSFEKACDMVLNLKTDDSGAVETIARALAEENKQEKLQQLIDSVKDSALSKKLQTLRNTQPQREVTRVDKITAGMTSFLATPHFVFISDIEKTKLDRYGEIAEGFLDFLERQGLHGKPNSNGTVSQHNKTKESETFKNLVLVPTSIFILHDKMAERAFLKERLNFPHHVHGVFISSRNVLVTYDGAGPGIYLHELMHMVLSNFKHLEYWAEEGIPSYLEKSYGALHPQFTLVHDFPPNLYAQFLALKIKGVLIRPQIEQIVTSAKHASPNNEIAQRLVALFLARHDKLDTYLALTRENQHKGYKTFVEAAFEMPFSRLEADFSNFISALRKDTAKIDKLPPAQIFDDWQELKKFLQTLPAVSSTDFLNGKTDRYDGYDQF